MVDELIKKSLQISQGEIIVFWDDQGRRFEGKVLDCSDQFLKYFDAHRQFERLVSLDLIKEAELK